MAGKFGGKAEEEAGVTYGRDSGGSPSGSARPAAREAARPAAEDGRGRGPADKFSLEHSSEMKTLK